jgi:uncharacterized Fe-S cluster protein YjdI
VEYHYVDVEGLTINLCEGTHIAIGFSSENKISAADNNNDNDSNKRDHLIKDKRKNYVGKEITIHDNRKICSHAAECVNNLSSVFKFNSRPWITYQYIKYQIS